MVPGTAAWSGMTDDDRAEITTCRSLADGRYGLRNRDRRGVLLRGHRMGVDRRREAGEWWP